ncbi:MAG: oxygen-independent coproporphyrinogen III oxidase [Aquabacterium sp.]
MALSTSHLPAPRLSEDMLGRLDRPGPRYTSYPTADRFIEAFGPDEYRQALGQHAPGATNRSHVPLSLYVHVPFCESLCYYCACNKIVTRHHERATPYLDALRAEIALNVAVIGTGRPVSQLHLGGGTPTFLDDAELRALMDALKAAFRLTPGAEVSIEVDPRTISPQRLAVLWELGFNRLSFGVQDFDVDVQKAVHRIQPQALVVDLVQAARQQGFTSINLDLIYGLPRQTPQTFARTVEQVCAIRPDRIAVYAYAHLPQRFKAQRRIATASLPPAEHRVAMLGSAISGFMDAGYQYIGMDHFALPGDPLAHARRQGSLHRNFQGYTTQPDSDLIGLGVSSISKVGSCYAQSAKTLEEYYDAIRAGRFPTVRGLALTRDDLVRRSVIMALMCQGRPDFESIELSHLIDVPSYFRPELADMRALADMGLVDCGPRHVEVTALGWYFVRTVAMVFDRHLREAVSREHFSRLI